MVAGSDVFEVFTHLDYAVRHWPSVEAGPFDPSRFEEGFRAAMRAIADSGRALEMNTRRLQLWMPQWWRAEGGRAVTFGSDAHIPEALADGFPKRPPCWGMSAFAPGNDPKTSGPADRANHHKLEGPSCSCPLPSFHAARSGACPSALSPSHLTLPANWSRPDSRVPTGVPLAPLQGCVTPPTATTSP